MRAWPPAVGIARVECHLSSSMCDRKRRLPGACCPGLWPPAALPALPAARHPASWSGRSTAWILRRLETSLAVLKAPSRGSGSQTSSLCGQECSGLTNTATTGGCLPCTHRRVGLQGGRQRNKHKHINYFIADPNGCRARQQCQRVLSELAINLVAKISQQACHDAQRGSAAKTYPKT